MSKARQSKRQRYRKPRKEYSEGSRVGFADSGYVGSGRRSIWSRMPGRLRGKVGKPVDTEEVGYNTTGTEEQESKLRPVVAWREKNKQRRLERRAARQESGQWYLGKNLGADPSARLASQNFQNSQIAQAADYMSGTPFKPVNPVGESRPSVRKFLNTMAGTSFSEKTPIRDAVANRPKPVQAIREYGSNQLNRIPGMQTFRSYLDYATPLGNEGPVQSPYRWVRERAGFEQGGRTKAFAGINISRRGPGGFEIPSKKEIEAMKKKALEKQSNNKPVVSSNNTTETNQENGSGTSDNQTDDSTGAKKYGTARDDTTQQQTTDSGDNNSTVVTGGTTDTTSSQTKNTEGTNNTESTESTEATSQAAPVEQTKTLDDEAEAKRREDLTRSQVEDAAQGEMPDQVQKRNAAGELLYDADDNPIMETSRSVIPDAEKAGKELVVDDNGNPILDSEGKQQYKFIDDTAIKMERTQRTPEENKTAFDQSDYKKLLPEYVDNAMYTASDGTVFPSNAEGKLYEQFLEETQGKDIAGARIATPDTEEEVTTVDDVSQVKDVTEGKTAAQVDEVTKVDEDASVTGATGTVGDKSTVDIDKVKVTDTPDIEAAKFADEYQTDDPAANKALVDTVTGVLSPEAKASAVKVAGLSERKITRYKKQLRNAGLSEEEIKEIGNDPESLEERVLDFTEEERGVIEGLPEEALVSTQIEGLLEGMENGEPPAWARPAVSAVNQMLAQRGLSASTVGRDALFNAIIQSALPIAQSNAQAIQASVAQTKNIEAQEAAQNAQMAQETAMQNASVTFQMDMANFNAAQQAAVTNAKFFQTVALTETNNRQQAAVQNAVITSQENIAEADMQTRARINNANAFLKMDMANLNNEQQAKMVEAQIENERILSNQAAENLMKQFNTTEQNKVDMFMTNIQKETEMANAAAANDMSRFNAAQENAAEARRVDRDVDVEKFNAQMRQDIDKSNAEFKFRRESWNATNAAAVQAGNVAWRRRSNEVNTAAQNAVNMQNAMNSFSLTPQALSFLWQEQRDIADHDWKSYEAAEQRMASVVIAALGAGGDAYDSKHWASGFNNTILKSLGILGIENTLEEMPVA